jgi:hypothetical protein
MGPSAVRLNRIAQGTVPLEEGLAWFEGLDASDRFAVLRELASYCHQAHPHLEEGALAIERSGLKPTFTPCVLLQKAIVPERAVWRIAALPTDEQLKAFRLLMTLLTIADARRRATQCKDGCSHEWHALEPPQ